MFPVFDMVTRWESYAKTSTSISKNGLIDAQRIGEGVKYYVNKRAREICHGASGAPVVISCGSDGTPLTTVETYTQKINNKTVIRHGKKLAEYLIERAYIRAQE